MIDKQITNNIQSTNQIAEFIRRDFLEKFNENSIQRKKVLFSKKELLLQLIHAATSVIATRETSRV